MRVVLTNAHVVTPDAVIERGSVVIEDGLIAAVTPRRYPPGAGVLDLDGRLLLPGFVDLHNDALEKEINPRPRAALDVTYALAQHDRRLAAAGVTTEFHAVEFIEEETIGRSLALTARLVTAIRALRAAPYATIDNRILYRVEIRTPGAWEQFVAAVPEQGALVSLSHHLANGVPPRDLVALRPHLLTDASDPAALDPDDAEARVVVRTLQAAAREREQRGLTIGSHDDDTPDRIDLMYDLGCRIAEFPTTVAAAARAHERGMPVVMGAPNALRGNSLSGAVSALGILSRGLLDILVADYHAPALLGALFRIVALGLADLPAATRLVTANPAATCGLTDRGEVAIGKRGDLIAVRAHGPVPVVDATLVGGDIAYTSLPLAQAFWPTGDADQ